MEMTVWKRLVVNKWFTILVVVSYFFMVVIIYFLVIDCHCNVLAICWPSYIYSALYVGISS
jgi:hypothetical protein